MRNGSFLIIMVCILFLETHFWPLEKSLIKKVGATASRYIQSFSTNLYFVVRWCTRTNISSLANSFPGHAWVPLPNGMYVLGFGATCSIIQTKPTAINTIQLSLLTLTLGLWKYQGQFTSNLEGSNFSGSGKTSGLWWMFLNSGKTFHPFGIRYPEKLCSW